MKQPGSTRRGTTPIALVAALALALPGVAAAQDPSVDQYTPTAPDGGGSVPTSPVPNTEGGNGGPAPADTGSNGGSSESTAPVDSGSTASTDPTAAAPDESTGSGSGGHEKAKSNDERTLDGLAATASVQREQASSGNDSPATELLRSDSGGGLGMGVFLWAVLGVTALWAVATVVRRRQGQDGHPA